jgi:hypothetical protein
MGKMGKVKVAQPAKKMVVVAAAPKKKKKKQSQAVKGFIPSGTLSAIGGLAGGYFGGPLGSAIGSTAGKLISRITGFGAYKVNKNSLVTGNSVPSFRQDGDGVVVAHREFLTNVIGSVEFKLNAYAINPALRSTFPWAALLAANFEEYEPEGLVFIYRPSSGSAISSVSSALGVVIMATDYDALNPLFTNKQQMESYEFASSTVPFTECLHPVECAKQKNVLDNLYTRTGSIPDGADLRMYDMGNFQIATQGMQSVYTVGELWVSYHFRFRKPRIPSSPTTNFVWVADSSPVGSATSAFPFGTGLLVPRQGTFYPGITPVDSKSIELSNVGLYFVLITSRGSDALNAFWTINHVGTNIDYIEYFTDPRIVAIAGLYDTDCVSAFCFEVFEPGTGYATNQISVNDEAKMGMANGDTTVTIYPMLNDETGPKQRLFRKERREERYLLARLEKALKLKSTEEEKDTVLITVPGCARRVSGAKAR